MNCEYTPLLHLTKEISSPQVKYVCHFGLLALDIFVSIGACGYYGYVQLIKCNRILDIS